MLNNKKGNFNNLVGFAIAIATVVVIVMVTLIITAQGKSEIGKIANTTSVEYNASQDLATGFAIFPTFMPMIILAGVGASILGMIALFKSRGM